MFIAPSTHKVFALSILYMTIDYMIRLNGIDFRDVYSAPLCANYTDYETPGAN